MGTLQYELVSQAVILSSDPVKETLADRLKEASLNTLFGFTIVFAVLILIILFISLFKIIPYLQGKYADKSIVTNSSVDHVIAQILETEEDALVEDYELIAVITAAINASLGDAVPADGLVVRSIRRMGSRR